MTAAAIVSVAATLSLAILGLAFLVTVYRVVVGPTLPDRVLALDMLVAIAMGFIAAVAIKTGFTLYIDIAISLGLVGFLATVAFARFILTRAAPDSESIVEGAPMDGSARKPPKKAGKKRNGKSSSIEAGSAGSRSPKSPRRGKGRE